MALHQGRHQKGFNPRQCDKGTPEGVKGSGRFEAAWQPWSRARHESVVNRTPLAGLGPVQRRPISAPSKEGAEVGLSVTTRHWQSADRYLLSNRGTLSRPVSENVLHNIRVAMDVMPSQRLREGKRQDDCVASSRRFLTTHYGGSVASQDNKGV